MLIDDAVAALKSQAIAERLEVMRSLPPAQRGEALRKLTILGATLKRCQPFVMSPLTLSTCADLADPKAIARSRPHLFTPAELTFIDCSADRPAWTDRIQARRTGIAMFNRGTRNEASLTEGDLFLIVASDGGVVPYLGRYDLIGPGPIVTWAPESQQAIRFIDPDAVGNFLAVALALINTPRASHITRAELSKLNRARSRKDLPPILEHKIVTLKIDAGELGHGFQAHQTQERALHHVRAFMRLSRGRIEIVRPHWRGNPRFGVIQHRYIAVRAEDEPGPWMGGPVAPPKVIKQFEDKD